MGRRVVRIGQKGKCKVTARERDILRPIETGHGEGVEVRLSGGQGEKL